MRVVISGILIGIVAVVAVLVLRSGSDSLPNDQANGANNVRIAVLDNDVLLKNLDNAEFNKIEKESNASEGSEIKTSSSGRASLLYPNATIANLAESSHLIIKNLENNSKRSKLRLVVGGIWSKIENILGTGDAYEIETENMVASVRGTIFAVEFHDGVSWIASFENKIIVTAINPKTGEAIEGGIVELNAGEKTIIDNKAMPSKSNPLKQSLITAVDLERKIVKNNIINFLNTPSVKVIWVRLKQASPLPTPTPKPDSISSPQATPSPTPSLVIKPKTIQAISSPTPTPIPTPEPKPVITSVTPVKLQKSEKGNVEFAINGQYLTGAKNVFLNQFELQFFALDSFTIFATVGPNIEPGIYDVSVVVANGEKLTLPRALEVQ